MSETPLSRNSLYAARPVIRVNEQEHERINLLFKGMDMIEQEDGFSSVELRFDNLASLSDSSTELAFEDESIIKLGDRITVLAGDEQAPTEVFRGMVSGIESTFTEQTSPELTILAEDDLQKARMSKRTKVYENMTLASIAQEIAGNLGLTANVTGLTSDLGVQVQMNESDLTFLRRLLARSDGDVQVVGDELHVAPRGQVRRGSVELQMQAQLRKATILADLSHQVTEVSVTGWDASQGQVITGSSTGAQQGPGSGRTGASFMNNSFGSRSHHISHLHVNTSTEADALAQAAYDERQRKFVTVQGTAEGNPALRVGTNVILQGLGSRFSNTYYVTRCHHRFDGTRGYETDFTGECAFLGNP